MMYSVGLYMLLANCRKIIELSQIDEKYMKIFLIMDMKKRANVIGTSILKTGQKRSNRTEQNKIEKNKKGSTYFDSSESSRVESD